MHAFWPAAQSSELYHRDMSPAEHDVARIRLDNALLLFDEFVAATVKHPDAATLRGLDRRFAERLQIQPSYWSQIKSRARQIGEKLARQFEILSHKPRGWMDEDHRGTPALVPSTAGPGAPAARGPAAEDDSGRVVPRDDDERFIVGLVLTYYRRHPDRARTRLLDLLGEVLVASAAPAPPPAPAPARKADDTDLWQRTRAGIAPLKRK
jgi:hypothetical protein